MDDSTARAEDNVIELGSPQKATWSNLVPRTVAPEQWERYEGHIAEIFESFGMPLDTPGTKDTPRRFLRALAKASHTIHEEPARARQILRKRFSGVADEVYEAAWAANMAKTA